MIDRMIICLFCTTMRKDDILYSLILLDKEKITSADFDTYAYPLIDLGWQFGEYFSTKLYTFTEWMKRKGTPFFKNVELDGIEL